MKYTFLFLLIVFYASIALAQKGILAGKVVDEHGQPMEKVKIELKQHDKTIIQKTNKDGLYYIDQLTKGNYTITIQPKKREKYIAKNVAIESRGINHTYYTFILSGSEVQVIPDKHDPFIAGQISALKSYKDIDATETGGKTMIIDFKTGEVQETTEMPKYIAPKD